MTTASLQSECKGLNIAHRGMECEDMVDLLKASTLVPSSWEALLDECAQYNVDSKGVPSGRDTDNLWCQFAKRLLQQLVQNGSIQIWVDRRFPVQRLPNYHAAAEMIKRYAEIDAMSSEEMIVKYDNVGVPRNKGMEMATIRRPKAAPKEEYWDGAAGSGSEIAIVPA